MRKVDVWGENNRKQYIQEKKKKVVTNVVQLNVWTETDCNPEFSYQFCDFLNFKNVSKLIKIELK